MHHLVYYNFNPKMAIINLFYSVIAVSVSYFWYHIYFTDPANGKTDTHSLVNNLIKNHFSIIAFLEAIQRCSITICILSAWQSTTSSASSTTPLSSKDAM